MKNILAQFFILFAFFIGSVSVGNAHFIDLDGGQDMVVVQGKRGTTMRIELPSHFFTKNGELTSPLTFKVINDGRVYYKTTTLDKNITIPSLDSLKGQISFELQILDYQEEICFNPSLF